MDCGTRKKDREPCFEKSFASHEKAECWSSKNKKSVKETFLNSRTKVWFDCDVCPHEFEARVDSVSNGSWCPYCANKKLCDCEPCYKKSFTSHEKAECWSDRNKKSARETFLNSRTKAWFKCDVCPHEFEAQVSHVSNGSWCPYCANPPKRLCDCETCYKKSFASHEKAECWSSKNKKSARETFLNSNIKAWFKCEKKHEFKAQVDNVSNGRWCPKCKHKTELLVLEFLCLHFEKPKHQYKAKWCKNPKTNRKLPFDICVSKTIIEVDGRQHYEQVANWKTPEETQKNDRYKEECALKNGYSIIRILQKDVWNNKIDWKKLLLEHIKDHETPVVIRLWKEEISDIFMAKYITGCWHTKLYTRQLNNLKVIWNVLEIIPFSSRE
ncbi:putative restriction endonuclease [Insectomime virus]|nr:putative restriction endonuclease [Insectomime virus]